MILSGIVGGFINYYLNSPPEDESVHKSILLGIGASLLVPLFLNIISSNLIEQCKSDMYKLLVFAGFCLVAAIFSKSFINTVSESALKVLKKEVNELQKEVKPIIDNLTENDTNESIEINGVPRSDIDLESEPVNRLSGPAEDNIKKRFLLLFSNQDYVYRSKSFIQKQLNLDTRKLNALIEELGDFISVIGEKYALTRKGIEELKQITVVTGIINTIADPIPSGRKSIYHVILKNGSKLRVYSDNKDIDIKENDHIIARTVDGERVDIKYIEISRSKTNEGP